MALPFPSLSTIASAPAVVDSVVGWLWTLALFLFPGLVAAGLCARFSPPSASGNCSARSPERAAPDLVRRRLALSVPYLTGVVLTVTLAGEAGPAWSEGFLVTALFGGIGVGLVAPAVAVIGLPRLGTDWDPTGYGPGTWGASSPPDWRTRSSPPCPSSHSRSVWRCPAAGTDGDVRSGPSRGSAGTLSTVRFC